MTRAILAFTANEMLLLLTFYFGLHIKLKLHSVLLLFKAKQTDNNRTNGVSILLQTITFALLGLLLLLLAPQRRVAFVSSKNIVSLYTGKSEVSYVEAGETF